MFRPVMNTTLKAAFIGSLISSAVVAIVTLSVWRAQTFKNSTAVALLRGTLDAEIARRQVFEEGLRGELDGIQRTLYSAPEAPAPGRTPSALEAWQRNRDQELRDRIRRLEGLAFFGARNASPPR